MTYNEDDFCSLNPTKLCDNCCKCLEPHDAYRILHADMHLADIGPEEEEDYMPEADLAEDALFTLLAAEEEEAEDAETFGFGKNIPPLYIDPALLAEWEAKLADIGQSEQEPQPKLYGIRQKRRP